MSDLGVGKPSDGLGSLGAGRRAAGPSGVGGSGILGSKSDAAAATRQPAAFESRVVGRGAPAARAPALPHAILRQRLLQLLELDRLREVVVHAGLFGARHVLEEGVGGHGDYGHVGGIELVA